MGSGMVDFYHYTSESSADQIIQSGMIYESEDGGPDARLGKGVYGTALPPSSGKKQIASNNWAGGWKNREKRGHVDYVFKISIPRSNVREEMIGKRHLYLHRGVVRLNSYSWECFEV